MASPFKPSVNHVDSVENFDKIWTDQAAEDSPCGTPPARDAFAAAAAAFEVRATLHCQVLLQGLCPACHVERTPHQSSGYDLRP